MAEFSAFTLNAPGMYLKPKGPPKPSCCSGSVLCPACMRSLLNGLTANEELVSNSEYGGDLGPIFPDFADSEPCADCPPVERVDGLTRMGAHASEYLDVSPRRQPTEKPRADGLTQMYLPGEY